MSLLSAGTSSRSEDLQYSRLTPQFIEARSGSILPAFATVIVSAESAEQWEICEQLILSCLRTGDDNSAHLCLERLVERFGSSNEHVMALRGLYQEAVAADSRGLEQVLEEYEDVLTANATNFSVMKRRARLLKSLSRRGDAINAIVELLEVSPTDVEAWVELSDLYLSQGMFSQAIYCLEEALLIVPNAWNIHARIGELLLISSFSDSRGNKLETSRILTDAVRRYCRSIELCDDYLRGFYGLKLATDRLLTFFEEGGMPMIQSNTLSFEAVRALNTRAGSHLKVLVDQKSSGLDEAEVIAAKTLLDQKSP